MKLCKSFFYASPIVVVLSIILFGCHTRDADEGSVRATRQELAGIYGDVLDDGHERLELLSDGTFVQEFTSASRAFRQNGRWQLETSFLNGSAIVLSNAAVPGMSRANAPMEPSYDHPLQSGQVTLYVHRRGGKLALARNEVADWYYERAK